MPREKVIVILVPGIFASDLVSVWPVNKTSKLLKQIYNSPTEQRVAFKEGGGVFQVNNLRKVSTTAQITTQRGWGGVSDDTYKPFLEACQNATSDELPFDPIVYAIGYNFVLSNSITATYIANRTTEILALHQGEASRFIYVTHSMGALPVRLALRRAGAAYQQKCICVIHVAAPNAGTPEPLMRFIRGVVEEAGSFSPAAFAVAQAVEFLFGDTGWKCITSASAIPAGFELLPIQMLRDRDVFSSAIVESNPVFDGDDFSLVPIINTFLSAAGFSVTLELFNGSTSTLKPPPLPLSIDTNHYKTAISNLSAVLADFNIHLAAAQHFHAAELDGYFFARTGALVLKGKKTVIGLQVRFDGSNLIRASEIIGDGDGTVPIQSQRYRIPPEFTARTESLRLASQGNSRQPTGRQFRQVRFNPLREISGVAHADALGQKGKDAGSISHTFALMTLFYHAYPEAGQ